MQRGHASPLRGLGTRDKANMTRPSTAGVLARIWKARIVYLFIAPYFVLFIVFQLSPLVWSFVLSFHQWTGLGNMSYVGLQNYRQLFRDELFHRVLWNTLLYWVVNVLTIVPLSLLLASLVNSSWLKHRNVLQTVIFLPYIVSWVAAGLVFYILYDHDAGLINALLSAVGLRPQPWLVSTRMSKIPVMTLIAWRLVPWYMLILYSGLKTVDPQFYDAADIEGASHLQKLVRITIPLISTLLFFCFITLTIESFRIFAQPYVLTRGGPANSSMSIVQYLYNNGFEYFKLGYASTIGYALAVMLLVVSWTQLRLMIRRNREMNE